MVGEEGDEEKVFSSGQFSFHEKCKSGNGSAESLTYKWGHWGQGQGIYRIYL